MPGLAPTAIADFVLATNESTLRHRYQSISTRYQHYEFVGRYVPDTPHRKIKRGKARIVGTGLHWFYKVRTAGTAEKTGLYAPTTGMNIDLMAEITVPMAMGRAYWQYDAREAAAQGSGPEQLLDYVAVREDDANESYADFQESWFWNGGSVSTAQEPDFIGITDWITKGSTAAFSFGGGNPSGHSSGIGNLSRTTYENLKNGTAQYDVINDTDLLPTWEEARRKTHFQSPVSYAALERGMPDCVQYVNDTFTKQYQTYLTLANDNLRVDAGRYRGSMMFKNAPVVWIPVLDADTTNPMYMINWNTFEYVPLPGWELKRNRPFEVGAQQEHVWRVTMNWWGQLVCYNPRSNAVIHNAA